MKPRKPKKQGPLISRRASGFIAQAFKTTLAATLALYLGVALGMPEPYWAAISAIIVMQSDLESLEIASINRLAGTAIGASVGALVVYLLGNHLWAFALGIFLAILICAAIGRWETYRFAGVTVAIVMLITRQGNPWMVAWHRFLEVSFGILVAFVFSWLALRLAPTRIPRSS